MSKPVPSPLALAAAAFDDVLASYARLAELFVKAPLTSVKHLERANTLLEDIAACEPKLQVAAQAMLAALGDARTRQEGLSAEVVAHAPAVQRRNQELRDLMERMAALATDVGGLNATIARPGDPTTSPPTAPDVAEVSERVLALSTRAQQLAASAHEFEFEEVATQAHALHQRLLSIGEKLRNAAGN